MRVLVIGDDTRSFLAVVRSLGRRGWDVDAAPFDHSSPALYSRHLRRVHRVDAYSLSPDRWVERLRSLAADEGFAGGLNAHDGALTLPSVATAVADELGLDPQKDVRVTSEVLAEA